MLNFNFYMESKRYIETVGFFFWDGKRFRSGRDICILFFIYFFINISVERDFCILVIVLGFGDVVGIKWIKLFSRM